MNAEAGDTVSLSGSPQVRLRLSRMADDDPRRMGTRGITIHWTESIPLPARRRRKSPQVAPVSRYFRVPFTALHPKHADEPPSKDEHRRYALMAYALAALANPIPSDAEVLYEVGYD